jgi:hypothetical protein
MTVTAKARMNPLVRPLEDSGLVVAALTNVSLRIADCSDESSDQPDCLIDRRRRLREKWTNEQRFY